MILYVANEIYGVLSIVPVCRPSKAILAADKDEDAHIFWHANFGAGLYTVGRG